MIKIKQLFYSYPIIHFVWECFTLKPQQKEYMMLKFVMKKKHKQKDY